MYAPSSEETNHASTPPVLPDSLPQVSFDINLGKRVNHIDFDYPAYMTHLQEKGLSPEQIQNSRVTFEAGRPFSSVLGRYSKKNSVQIGVGRKNTQEDLNSSLAHETQHYVDDMQGKIGKRDLIVYALEHSTRRTGWQAMFGGMGVEYYGLFEPNPFLVETGVFITVMGAGSLAVSGIIRSHFNKPEQRAAKSEKAPPSVITLQ